VAVISSGQALRVVARCRHFSRPGLAGVGRPAPTMRGRIWLFRSLGDPAMAAAALRPSLVVVVGHMDRLRGRAQPRRSLRAAVPLRNGTERSWPWFPSSNSTADAKRPLSHGNRTLVYELAAQHLRGRMAGQDTGPQ